MRSKKQLGKLAIILSSILLIISSLNNIIILEEREPVQNDVPDKNNENNNLISPKSSGAWIYKSIYIDDGPFGCGNGSWNYCATTYPWCSDKGSYYLIENITLIPGGSGTGILIAKSSVSFRIENCTILQKNTGIKFESVSNGKISNCYAAGSVAAGHNLGGLCGTNEHSTIINCFAASSVAGSHALGGLCGTNDQGTISNCYATGRVSGASTVTGFSEKVTQTEEGIEEQIRLRKEAREKKDFLTADNIRKELAAKGIILEDRPDGTTRWKR